MRFCGAAMIVFVPVSPDLSSGESEEEERVCGMSGEKVRLEKNLLSFRSMHISFGLHL